MKKVLLFIVAVIFTAAITGQDATIYKLPDGVSPVIDGYVDNIWLMFEKYNIDKPFMEEEPTLDMATWQAAWDENSIFIIISVEDNDFCPAWCEAEMPG